MLEVREGLFRLTRLFACRTQAVAPGLSVYFAGGRRAGLQLFVEGRQRGPLDQFHGVVTTLVLDAGGEDLNQVRMLDLPQRLDLPGEARFRLAVARLQQALECYLAAERRLPG